MLSSDQNITVDEGELKFSCICTDGPIEAFLTQGCSVVVSGRGLKTIENMVAGQHPKCKPDALPGHHLSRWTQSHT